MRLRLALFDLDGTLVDSQAHIVAAMAAAFAAVDRPPPPRDTVLAQVGLSLPVVIDRLSGGIAAVRRERMLAAYKEAYRIERAKAAAPLFSGIQEVLDELSRRDPILWGIATGASRRGMRAVIEAQGLSPATAQCADDHPSKPDPAMVRAALKECSVRSRDAVMIGDSTHDMAMARQAGVFALGVAWGYQSEDDLRSAGADGIVAAPQDLIEALDERWRGPGG